MCENKDIDKFKKIKNLSWRIGFLQGKVEKMKASTGNPALKKELEDLDEMLFEILVEREDKNEDRS